MAIVDGKEKNNKVKKRLLIVFVNEFVIPLLFSPKPFFVYNANMP